MAFAAGWLYLLVMLVAGCSSGGARNTVVSLMQTAIVFPKSLVGVFGRGDSIMENWPDVSYKLVVYMNSTQCDDCRLKDLLVWKHYMRRIDSLDLSDNLRVVFIFHPKDTTVLMEKLALYDFELPVWIDRNGEFERKNPLPEDPAFHTFLLGGDDRIVLVGSPVRRPKMWKLYEEMITGIISKR